MVARARRACWVVVGMLALSACRLFGGGDGADLKATSYAWPKAITTVKDWDGVDPEVRLEILGGEFRRYANLALTDAVDLSAVKDPAQKVFADKMAGYMRSNGDMEVVDPVHARIGALAVTAQVLVLGGKNVLGGVVRFAQAGCAMPDDTAPVFKTAAEAEVGGCDVVAGAQWEASGSFNHDGTPFEYGDFMDWMGPQ